MRFSGLAGDNSRHFKSVTREVGIAWWEFAKGLRSDLLHSSMNTGLPQHHSPLPVPHQLLEHFMQIYAKESQQCAWETINIYEQSPHKSKGRGIYSTFFGDFSRCSLLSHCARLHNYSSDNKDSSAISYQLCKQEQCWVPGEQTPRHKDEGLVPYIASYSAGFSHNQKQVVFAQGHSRSLGSASIHGTFGMQGTMVASQR